jgi:hypothetical protein
MRRTLYIGYGLRLLLSAIFPLGFGVGFGLVLFVDIWPGILSINIVNSLGIEPRTFLGTLLTTIVQGTLLNVIIFVIMSIAYVFQRMFMTPPPEFGPKGFDVVMPAHPAQPLTRV